MVHINNRKKIICFLLAFSMLLSGMCFESVQADFLCVDQTGETATEVTENISSMKYVPLKIGNISFGTSSEKENSSKIVESTGKIFEPEARAEQILNRNTVTASVKAAGKTRQNVKRITISGLPLQNKSETRLWFLYQEKRHFNDSNTVTISYIHRKDGKKDSVQMIK